MVDLPFMPSRIAALPRDARGFPVPWFVQWFDKHGAPSPPGGGAPDFRVIDSIKFTRCLAVARCWICGEKLGRHRVFLIGPMCCINRVISEPPSHRECAEFAVQACPFMVQPRMRRNEKNIPVDGVAPAGIHLDRNPGVTCLWETRAYAPFRTVGGILFRLGDPTRVDWWAHGRAATREEVQDAIEKGYPVLEDIAIGEGKKAIKELAILRERAMKHLPADRVAA